MFLKEDGGSDGTVFSFSLDSLTGGKKTKHPEYQNQRTMENIYNTSRNYGILMNTQICRYKPPTCIRPIGAGGRKERPLGSDGPENVRTQNCQ